MVDMADKEMEGKAFQQMQKGNGIRAARYRHQKPGFRFQIRSQDAMDFVR